MVRVPTSSTPRYQARRAASTWSTALPPSFHAVRPNARSERPRSRTNGPLRTSRDLSLTRPQTRGVNHRLKIVHIQSSRLYGPVGTTPQSAPAEAAGQDGATPQTARLTTGQLVPPLNPVPRCATTGLPRWGHPPVQRGSNMESPASSECQKGATRQFGRSLGPPPKPLPEQCHPSVCLRQDRPESPKHCHTSDTCQNSATRQFAER